MTYALNLCDCMMELSRQQIITECNALQIERIYVGSYFCGNYLLHSSNYAEIIAIAQDNSLSVTLVLPIIAQSQLANTIDWIDTFISKNAVAVDEVVCNDIAMMRYIENKYRRVRVICGRIMDRHCREFNDFSNFARNGIPNRIREVDADYACELDKRRAQPELANCHLHYPYSYITCGKICLFASISKSVDMKFRPNSQCKMQCVGKAMHYITKDSMSFFRKGCAIYKKIDVPVSRISGIERIIITPNCLEVQI